MLTQNHARRVHLSHQQRQRLLQDSAGIRRIQEGYVKAVFASGQIGLKIRLSYPRFLKQPCRNQILLCNLNGATILIHENANFGASGKGLFNENLYYVPEARNDFIFSYIGQTMGFVGCAIILLLITCLCVKILVTAKMAKDKLGTYICIGVFAMFVFQTVINIGMVLCVIPVIGITLPFFSSGGTSVLISYIGIGMVLSVYRQNRKDLMFD